MKQSFRILLFPGCQKFQQDEFGGYKKSVLLDSDMVEAFDDGVAFMMLLGSDDIEIKGLTTVTGNVWDLISVAIAIDSGIISEYKDVRLDVDDIQDSPTYGKVYETQLSSRQIVRVPLQINQGRFWDMITSRLSKY